MSLISLDIHVSPEDDKYFDPDKFTKYVRELLIRTVRMRPFSTGILVDSSINVGEITSERIESGVSHAAKTDKDTALGRFERTEPDLFNAGGLRLELAATGLKTVENSEIQNVGEVGDGRGPSLTGAGMPKADR